jgi:hypothetical protein
MRVRARVTLLVRIGEKIKGMVGLGLGPWLGLGFGLGLALRLS